MKRIQFYGAIAAFIMLIFLAAILPGMYVRMVTPVKKDIKPVSSPVNSLNNEKTAPDLSIEKAKAELREKQDIESDDPGKDPSTLAQVYAKYPDATVGNNMIAAWERISPKEKEKVQDELDKEITQAQEALVSNPEDKNAKSALFIATTLKKLCKNNFNYNLLETIPVEEGGLLTRSKKSS